MPGELAWLKIKTPFSRCTNQRHGQPLITNAPQLQALLAALKQLGQMSNTLPCLVSAQYPQVTSGCIADTILHQIIVGGILDTVGSVAFSRTSLI